MDAAFPAINLEPGMVTTFLKVARRAFRSGVETRYMSFYFTSDGDGQI